MRSVGILAKAATGEVRDNDGGASVAKKKTRSMRNTSMRNTVSDLWASHHSDEEHLFHPSPAKYETVTAERQSPKKRRGP